MFSRSDKELVVGAFPQAPESPPPNYRFKAHSLIHRPGYETVKRVLDLTTALALLALLFPVFLVIALLIVARDGAPVLFKHSRIGQDGKLFQVFKFRTMRNDAEAFLGEHPELLREFVVDYKLERDPRITRFGRWLRACSLDELPQLLNVVRGEMSLVGPRPVVEAELEKYGGYRHVYLFVKPGCAGLWQCSGRSNTSYDERVLIDVEYAMNASVSYDISIFFRTILAVVRRQGAR